ncbi:hypothetical protein ES332_D06G205900v1 [Gossypium tomentosum]|uniref:Uncharacterized protein n=1 Tax=Gossypium tomentosum TaxID=34277 RepID=A0A5D2KLL0_GOSTO|nr:hypothetical protein ES332_D06G205900v1 [Gossypium tomentosum]
MPIAYTSRSAYISMRNNGTSLLPSKANAQKLSYKQNLTFLFQVQCWASEEDSIRHTLCSHHILKYGQSEPQTLT